MSVGLGLPSASLARRELVRFFRERNRVIGALGTPLVFWLLIGSGYGRSFRSPGDLSAASYLAYLVPGCAALIVLFAAIFSTMSVIEDRREGFLQAVLVSPAPRTAIVLGKVAGGAAVASLQAGAFLLLSPLAGAPLGLLGLAAGVAVLGLLAAGLTGLGFAIAWKTDSVQGYHAVMNLFLMPLWLLSGALFPAAGAPGWLRAAMQANPLTYGVAALRRCLLASGAPAPENLPGLGFSLGVTAAFGLVTVAASVQLVRRRGSGGLPG